MQARSFSPMSEFTGSSIEAKCELVEKYKRAREKRTSKPVKSPYGVGRYYLQLDPIYYGVGYQDQLVSSCISLSP